MQLSEDADANCGTCEASTSSFMLLVPNPNKIDLIHVEGRNQKLREVEQQIKQAGFQVRLRYSCFSPS